MASGAMRWRRWRTRAVGLVGWIAHGRVSATDRAAVGEEGGSATLRRWYVYGASVVGLLWMLSGTRGAVEAVGAAVGGAPSGGTTESVPGGVVGLGVGLGQGGWLAPRFAEAGRQ